MVTVLAVKGCVEISVPVRIPVQKASPRDASVLRDSTWRMMNVYRSENADATSMKNLLLFR